MSPEQYEDYTYTVETTQSLWELPEKAASEIRKGNDENPDVGHLIH